MARSFHGARARLVRSGRKTFWFSSQVVSSALAAPNTAVLQRSLNAAALALRPFTIVRSRGWIMIRSDQNAATEQYEAAFGSIVVSDQALAIGVTAVPTPTTDDQSGWIVYEWGAARLEVITAIGADQRAGLMIPFDSKSMRKVEEGQTLIEVVESDAISAGCNMTTYNRMLVKLH